MDTILPSRFFDRLRKARTPEKRLLAAILEDAIEVYRDHAEMRRRHDRELLHEVETWFASDDAGYPFSFRRICVELGVDAAWVRQVLARWRAYQHALRDGVRPLPQASQPHAELRP
jgi:hypothetical protein